MGEQRYPQETMGTTLVSVNEGDEWRRVFVRAQRAWLEVGEFTKGLLTRAVYDAPVHYHCVQLCDMGQKTLAEEFFAHDDRQLGDFMDALDEKNVPYGYLDVQAGHRITYRPARVGRA